MPATYKGRQVRVSLGTGTQYDGAGNAVGTTESFTHLRLSGLEVASERSPTSVGLAPNAITELPIGTNLREVQRRRSDNTLIVHYSGALELMGSALPLDTVHSGIVSELRARFREQSCDRILFLRADRRTPFRTIAALDVPLAAGGVDILGLEADQTTGTVSLVEGDRTGVAAADMHRIVPIYLRGPRPASQHANTEAAPIVLEVAADGAVRLNREPVPFSALFERMREIVALRPDRVVFVSAPSAPYEAVLRAIDQTRGAGIVILRLWPQGRTVPQGLPDIDLSRRVIAEGDFRRC
jgi:biopolymer transport protein ExbD